MYDCASAEESTLIAMLYNLVDLAFVDHLSCGGNPATGWLTCDVPSRALRKGGATTRTGCNMVTCIGTEQEQMQVLRDEAWFLGFHLALQSRTLRDNMDIARESRHEA